MMDTENTQTQFTFTSDDPGARFAYLGRQYRATLTRTDHRGTVRVYALRQTKSGRDYKRPQRISLTVKDLWKHGGVSGWKLAAYAEDMLRDVREDLDRWSGGTVEQCHWEALQIEAYRYRTAFIRVYVPLSGATGAEPYEAAYALSLEWQRACADPIMAAGHAADGWSPAEYLRRTTAGV